MTALDILKIRKSKKIVSAEEVETEFGPGYKAEVRVGNGLKTCHLIQDKETGEWKTFGDPHACKILGDLLEKVGTPIGMSTNEKLTEQPV